MILELEVGQYYRNQNGELIYIEEWIPLVNRDLFIDQSGEEYYENGQHVKGKMGMRLVCEI